MLKLRKNRHFNIYLYISMKQEVRKVVLHMFLWNCKLMHRNNGNSSSVNNPVWKILLSQEADKQAHLFILIIHHTSALFIHRAPLHRAECDRDLMVLFEGGEQHNRECKVKVRRRRMKSLWLAHLIVFPRTKLVLNTGRMHWQSRCRGAT